MYTVTSQLMLKVHKEDDGVPVICQVEHPAVPGNLQTQRYLEVQCEYLSRSVRGCHNQGPQRAWLRSNGNLPLTVLETRSPRCRCAGMVLFARKPSSWLTATCVLMWRKRLELSGAPFQGPRALVPVVRLQPQDLSASQRPCLLRPSQRALRFQQTDLGGAGRTRSNHGSTRIFCTEGIEEQLPRNTSEAIY